MTRHRQRTLDPADPSDADRLLVARTAYLDRMSRDPRFRGFAAGWRTAPGARRLLAAVLGLPIVEAPDLGAATSAQGLAAIRCLLRGEDSPALRAWSHARPVIAEALRDIAPPLPEWAADVCLLAALRDLLGWENVWVEFGAVHAGERPSRRRAKRDGESIARDVGWYYEARIADPPASVRRLADTYARETSRRTDARSIVQDGIKRAEAILNTPPLPE